MHVPRPLPPCPICTQNTYWGPGQFMSVKKGVGLAEYRCPICHVDASLLYKNPNLAVFMAANTHTYDLVECEALVMKLLQEYDGKEMFLHGTLPGFSVYFIVAVGKKHYWKQALPQPIEVMSINLENIGELVH